VGRPVGKGTVLKHSIGKDKDRSNSKEGGYPWVGRKTHDKGEGNNKGPRDENSTVGGGQGMQKKRLFSARQSREVKTSNGHI